MEGPSDADVYLDVVFDRGLLYLVVCNDGAVAAERVRFSFDRPLMGQDDADMTTLSMFSRLDYLAPGKHIRVFLDRAPAYFARRQRSRFTVKVSWRAAGQAFSSSMTHDMRIYSDLPYVADDPDTRSVRRHGR